MYKSGLSIESREASSLGLFVGYSTFGPNLQDLEAVPGVGQCAHDGLHRCLGPEVSDLHGALAAGGAAWFLAEFSKGSGVVVGSLLAVAIVEPKEGGGPLVREQSRVPDGVVLHGLLLALGFPQIGEVEVELGGPFGVFAHLGHPAHSQLLIDRDSLLRIGLNIRQNHLLSYFFFYQSLENKANIT